MMKTWHGISCYPYMDRRVSYEAYSCTYVPYITSTVSKLFKSSHRLLSVHTVSQYVLPHIRTPMFVKSAFRPGKIESGTDKVKSVISFFTDLIFINNME